MPLPFKTYQQPESHLVAGILIPKRGCLTVAEEVAMRDLSANLKEQTEKMTELQADVYLKQQVVAVLLKRVDKNWTIEQTQADEWDIVIDGETVKVEPTMTMLEDLFMFFMNEQKRWRSDEPQVEQKNGSKKQLTGAKSSGV